MKKNLKRNLQWFLLILFIGAILITWIMNHVGDFVTGFVEGFTERGNGGVLPEGMEKTAKYVGVAFALSVGAALLIWIYRIIKKSISDPVKKISEGMEQVRNGNLDVELGTGDGFEFGSMEESFNSMVKGLREAGEAQEINAEKNRKLYAEIAHDLKTPMTMILGYARLITSENADESKVKEYAKIIAEQTENANGLLEQMLEYAKLGSTEYRLELKEGNLAEILRQVTADSYFRFEEKKMELEVDIPDSVICRFDEQQIKRVFFNLIGNIIRHDPEGTKVVIGLKESESGGIKCIFADNGPLIEGELKEQLFEPFKTGDESRNSRNGSGLGLSVAKKIALLHGGDLEYRDEVMAGFKGFILELSSVSVS